MKKRVKKATRKRAVEKPVLRARNGKKPVEFAVATPLLLNVPDTARRLGLGRSVVYRLIQDGDLRSVKIGGSRRVLDKDIVAFVERLK